MSINERKFAVTEEVKTLWKKLQKEGRPEDITRELWWTKQGVAIAKTLKKGNLEVAQCTIEKRAGDNEENLYLRVKPYSQSGKK